MLTEHELEAMQSRKHCDPATKRKNSIPPAVISDVQKLHHVIRLLAEDLNANVKVFIDGMR
ncbi:unnamed protein product [Dibothriocephalus latus]|uniref:Uncharacterized protein n=1 Tax=Dibothriocephalus latus TaxID=60516 RepID=A0A3P6PKH4_DIBLA|nr:unnamed protein product [Dibothriocephalus latus]